MIVPDIVNDHFIKEPKDFVVNVTAHLQICTKGVRALSHQHASDKAIAEVEEIIIDALAKKGFEIKTGDVSVGMSILEGEKDA